MICNTSTNIQETSNLTAASSGNRKSQEKNRTDVRVGASIRYTRDVLSRTHTIKTGKTPGIGHQVEALEFSSQKAKALRLSTYSFPVFVIHKTKKQKNSDFSDNAGNANVIICRNDELE